MSIATLPSTNIVRRNPRICALDSHGRVYVHGLAFTSGGATNYSEKRLERYDPSTQVWSILAASNNYQYNAAWYIDSSDRIIYSSGDAYSSGGSFLGVVSTGEIYDPASNTWSSIASIPSQRENPFFWSDSAGLWAAGGSASAGSSTHLTTVVNYSGGTGGTWTTKTGQSALGVAKVRQPRALYRDAVDASGRVYIFGGNGDGGTATAEAYRYDPSVDSWSTLSSMPHTNQGMAVIFTPTKDAIYVVGGTQVATWKYTIATDAWTTLAVPPSGYGTTIASEGFWNPNTGLIDYFGAVNNTSSTPAIYQYNPATDSWSAILDSPSPTRLNPTCLFDGTGYYLVGGNTISGGLSYGTTVVEYWSLAASTSGAHNWATVIG